MAHYVQLIAIETTWNIFRVGFIEDAMSMNVTEIAFNETGGNLSNVIYHNSTTFISNDFLFLETKAARAFAGIVAFLAIIITCHQASFLHMW